MISLQQMTGMARRERAKRGQAERDCGARLAAGSVIIAQALLLSNWIAGCAGPAGFGILFFGRVAREERMMLETFGDSYRAYMARTGRVFPSIFLK